MEPATKDDINEVIGLLEKLNQAHGGTVIAHSKAIYRVRNCLNILNQRLHRNEMRLDRLVQ